MSCRKQSQAAGRARTPAINCRSPLVAGEEVFPAKSFRAIVLQGVLTASRRHGRLTQPASGAAGGSYENGRYSRDARVA